MAVVDSVPGLEVHILVYDEPLDEYEDTDQPATSNTVTKYVEAETEKQFELSYAFDQTPTDEGVLCQVSIDNNDWHGNHLLDTRKYPGSVSKIPGRAVSFVDSAWYARRFCFKEADELPLSPQTIAADDQDLGIITATFYWVQGIHNFDPIVDYSETARLTPAQPKIGKSKREDTRSHFVSFTDRGANQKARCARGFDKSSKVKFATFVFKYRSKDVLRSLGLIADEEVSQHSESKESADDPSTLKLAYRPKKFIKKRPADDDDAGATNEHSGQNDLDKGDGEASRINGSAGLAINTRKKPRI